MFASMSLQTNKLNKVKHKHCDVKNHLAHKRALKMPGIHFGVELLFVCLLSRVTQCIWLLNFLQEWSNNCGTYRYEAFHYKVLL